MHIDIIFVVIVMISIRNSDFAQKSKTRPLHESVKQVTDCRHSLQLLQ